MFIIGAETTGVEVDATTPLSRLTEDGESQPSCRRPCREDDFYDMYLRRGPAIGVLSHASWRSSRFTRRHSVLCLSEPDAGVAPEGGRLIEVDALGVSSH